MLTSHGRKRCAYCRVGTRRGAPVAMKVLVTGARGFLGREVLLALRKRGHTVRAIDVAGDRIDGSEDIELFLADLCESLDLERACTGIDAVVHLAGRMNGPDAAVLRSALVGTRRLLDAMEATGVRRMVLASSLAVYDWTAVGTDLREASPLEPRPESRDAYTMAKLTQEGMTRDRCARVGIDLAVLRPAAIWGPGREFPPTIGQRVGPVHLVFGGASPLTAVHVANCADAFAVAVESGIAGTFNVVDHPWISRRRFAGDHARRGRRGLVLSVPYRLGLLSAAAAERLAGPLRGKLPSFLHPRRFVARYGPTQINGSRFSQATGWQPPLSYEECLDRTYGSVAARSR